MTTAMPLQRISLLQLLLGPQKNNNAADVALSRSSSSCATMHNNSVVNFIDPSCNFKDNFISSEPSTQQTIISYCVNADAVKVPSPILLKKRKQGTIYKNERDTKRSQFLRDVQDENCVSSKELRSPEKACSIFYENK